MRRGTPIGSAAKCCMSSPQRTIIRHFSTTGPRAVYVKHALRQVLPKDQSEIPRYPYGPSRWFKQSNKGLYGGLFIQHGNNVGKKIAVKTRRTWHPNIQPHLLYSRALGRPIRLRVATRVLRTIDKLGGLDEYLVGSNTSARIKELGVTGWALRWRILQTVEMRKRFGITEEEKDWLGVAREQRNPVDTQEEGGRASLQQGKGAEEGVLKTKRASSEDVVVDDETKRELEAFDRVLDEEDRSVQEQEQDGTETVRRESEEKERRAEGTKRTANRKRRSEREEAESSDDSEMIQENPGVLNRLQGLFGRRR